MTSYDTLYNWYLTTFNLWKHHQLSWDTLENMFPFERDITCVLVKQWLEEVKEQEKKNQQQGR